MKKKNLFVITLTFLLALSMSAVAFAEDLDPPVDPGDDPSPYEYIQRASASCSISGGTARQLPAVDLFMTEPGADAISIR